LEKGVGMEEADVKERIITAYLMVIKNDSHLLEADANERSMTHKLAEYLQKVFPEYNVDCEYNRNGLDPKRINEFKKDIQSDDINAVTVYPDIIIHHRGSTDNFLVIEAKKTNNPGNDKGKLLTYKKDLHYQYAIFVQFPVGNHLTQYTVSACEDYIEFVCPEE
jgi:hypothetical protein